MDLNKLRWRKMSWEHIPPDMRENVLPFLTVPENINLNTAMTTHDDGGRLRDQLVNSYPRVSIPAFDTYHFTEQNNFEGVRWVIKAGMKLQNLELVIRSQGSGRLRDPRRVLRWLVEKGLHEDVAGLYATKSNTKDLGQDDMTLGTSILHLAASRGWAIVVHALMV